MDKASSKMTARERETFLREHGYAIKRITGSHLIWHNPKMQELTQKSAIEMPQNLRSVEGQSPSEITVPLRLAEGTWQRIRKQVLWCAETLATAEGKQLQTAKSETKKKDLLAELSAVRGFRRAVSLCLRGFETEMPAAPACGTALDRKLGI